MVEEDKEELTLEEKEELAKYMGYGSPIPDAKHNVWTFLHNVAIAKDTTKTGFLSVDEVGLAKHPLRTYKHLALISNKIMNSTYLGEYWISRGEILTATSLSKDAKLLELAVVTRKEIGDITKSKKPNSGWFKKKETSE